MTTKTNDTPVSRRFPKDDPIQASPQAEDSILTLEEQLGTVEIELNKPLDIGGGAESAVDVLVVEAPDADRISLFEAFTNESDPEKKSAAEKAFYGSCCINIPSAAVGPMHGKDWRRIQRLMTNFV